MSESNQTLRFGILGTAKITRRLVPAIREAANAELCAIASRTTSARCLVGLVGLV